MYAQPEACGRRRVGPIREHPCDKLAPIIFLTAKVFGFGRLISALQAQQHRARWVAAGAGRADGGAERVTVDQGRQQAVAAVLRGLGVQMVRG